jgi:hypothetical protein
MKRKKKKRSRNKSSSQRDSVESRKHENPENLSSVKQRLKNNGGS